MAPVAEAIRPAFRSIVTYFSADSVEGWIEYWVWDLILGRRGWPPGVPPSEDIIVDLHQLMEVGKSWFVWSFARQIWGVVPLKVWAAHAKTTSYLEAQDKCRVFQREYARAKEGTTRPKASGVEEGH